MFHNSPSSPVLSLWKRIAAFLSFFAVLSVLIAPASMLAEEVGIGKLGGFCLVNTAGAGVGDAAPIGSHCDLCGLLAFALPVFTVQTLPSQTGQQIADIDLPRDLAPVISGFPPSRGPPAF